MSTEVKELSIEDLREMIEDTVRRTLEDYLEDLRLLAPPGMELPSPEPSGDIRPLADRPLKHSPDH
jgi:hypothetical protein